MKKKILRGFLAVFLICIVIVFVLLKPYLKTAFGLGKVLNADSVEFQVTMHLNPDTLSENEENLMNTLEWIFQVEEEDLLSLHFRGQGTKNEMTVKVYCDAVEYPLTEIDYGENQKTVNIKMFYEAIGESLPDKLWLLKMLLPEWNLEEETVTFEQLESMGIDLETIIPLEKGKESDTSSTIQYIYLLSQLDKEKDEDGNIWFCGEYENYFLKFCVKEKEGATVILLEGEAMGEVQRAGTFEADITAVGN